MPQLIASENVQFPAVWEVTRSNGTVVFTDNKRHIPRRPRTVIRRENWDLIKVQLEAEQLQSFGLRVSFKLDALLVTR